MLISEIEHTLNKKAEEYGNPLNSHEILADLMTVYLNERQRGIPIKYSLDVTDALMFKILDKISRLMVNPRHLDSKKDVIGYLEILHNHLKEFEPYDE